MRSCNGNLQKLQEPITECQQELTANQNETQQLQGRLQQASLTIKILRRKSFPKRLQRKERQLHLKEAVVAAHEGGHCKRTIKGLRKEKKLLQTKVSYAKLALQRIKESSAWKIGQLEHASEELTHIPMEKTDIPIIKLKDDKGHFKPEAKVCVMALTGECEVPASRCGAIIPTVVQQIMGAEVPEGDFPSQRTALRFCDQAHVLSKAHVAEKLHAA